MKNFGYSMKSAAKQKLAKHFAACSAAAITACAVAAPEARAAVVYYQPNGGAGWIIPDTTAGLYINVETQNTGEAPVTGWDLNPYSSSALRWYGSDMLRYPGILSGSAGSLDFGTIVDNSGSYGNGYVTLGSGPGQWKLNSPNYFGFRFLAADNLTHYGWGRMDVGATITTRSIMEIGYENVAGVGISVGAGASPAPVPGPLPLFGAATAFVWSRRMRRRCLKVQTKSNNNRRLTSPSASS